MRFTVAIALCCLAFGARAQEALQKVELGTDLATLDRGADTVMNVCNSCHSLKYVRFRHLAILGIAKDKLDLWRGGQSMGETIASPMSAETALESFGKVPPDLSLITGAREGGPNYVYSYLLGYYFTPTGALANRYFPGTKLPDVLEISGVTDANERVRVEQQARDVVSFLAWAADPHAQERHKLGYYVIGYLVVFTALLYLLKRRIWSRLGDADKASPAPDSEPPFRG